MRNPRVLCNTHGNSPSGLCPRACACIFHKTLGGGSFNLAIWTVDRQIKVFRWMQRKCCSSHAWDTKKSANYVQMAHSLNIILAKFSLFYSTVFTVSRHHSPDWRLHVAVLTHGLDELLDIDTMVIMATWYHIERLLLHWIESRVVLLCPRVHAAPSSVGGRHLCAGGHRCPQPLWGLVTFELLRLRRDRKKAIKHSHIKLHVAITRKKHYFANPQIAIQENGTIEAYRNSCLSFNLSLSSHSSLHKQTDWHTTYTSLRMRTRGIINYL